MRRRLSHDARDLLGGLDQIPPPVAHGPHSSTRRRAGPTGCVSLCAMAIRITRVYTRTGDAGETALVGGRRVPKDSPRIEAYGTIDELNSIIGLARVFNAEQLDRGRVPSPARRDPSPGAERALRPRQRARHAARRRLRGHVPRERRGGDGPRAADGRVPEGAAAAQVVHPARRRPRSAASCIRPARCAGAPSAGSSPCRARSRSASGRSSTSIG